MQYRHRSSWSAVGLGALLACGAACTGTVGDTPPSGAGGGGGSPTSGAGGGGGSSTNPGTGGMVDPFEQVTDPGTVVRKVKNLLTGMAPTDEDIATVKNMGTAGLQTLITTWTTDAQFQDKYRDKMVFFFRNVFQQTGFTPNEDFKLQLLQNGGFDFGPLGTGAVGDDIFARLVQNVQDSFALTAWGLVAEGRPFTDVLTTQRFRMTTALKSLYIQIEMPNDEPFAFGATNKIPWKINMNGTAIPLEETLNPSSPNYMTFDDVPPTTAARFVLTPTCQNTAVVNSFTGYAQLFQRLIGYTPRYPFAAQPQCWEHPSRPYFTVGDTQDWQWVTITSIAPNTKPGIQPYDIPALRTATSLGLALPRVGFYTTPAYLALWNTNDSNAHRVTANQTLLVALGQSFTSENQLVPLSMAGLDSGHSVAGSECYACHILLDPMRNFWATQFDYNDRNDFPTRGTFNGGVANPRPSATGGAFAFGSVNSTGGNMLALGPLLAQVTDNTVSGQPVNRFAVAMTQKLCFFANSSACVESDPEFRRVALAFQNSDYSFNTLVKELLSSALVTGAKTTTTFEQNGITISVSRRDQLCGALSNRLGKPDICSLAVPIPASAQATTARIATSVPADAFSRGAESPVTATEPTLFFRAAGEMLCENISAQVVDAATATVWSSSSFATAIDDMVTRIMGYPPGDPNHGPAVTILTSHYNTIIATTDTGTRKHTPTTALRSTFTLACESPTAVSFGL